MTGTAVELDLRWAMDKTAEYFEIRQRRFAKEMSLAGPLQT